jgi:hypothetical protein
LKGNKTLDFKHVIFFTSGNAPRLLAELAIQSSLSIAILSGFFFPIEAKNIARG